jgi:glycosyltransferase involved in cell wall biosynthesis
MNNLGEQGKMQLSVVLISKNQEWNIPRLVESVLCNKPIIRSMEIVLVDSASTDQTVNAARQYPIRIVELHRDQRLTAGAGRYIGYMQTSGDYLLFLDGDMELAPGWLPRALDTLEDNPNVAAVTGKVIDRPRATPVDDRIVPDQNIAYVPMMDVKHGGGAAMYRRSVLEEVGTFHPYVYSDEEPELCVRIRHNGYRVVQLEYPIAYHYSDPSEALSTLIARWKRRLYLGAGQNLRNHLGKEVFWPYVKERGFGIVPAIGILTMLLSLVVLVATRRWFFFAACLVALLAVVSVDAYRKRSLYRTVYSLLLRLLIADGTIRGFLLPPIDPLQQPVRFEVIQ